MSVGTAAAIALGVGAAGSIAGGIIQGSAAKSAAKTQASAAQQVGQEAGVAADTATGDVNQATTTANEGITSSNAGLTAAQQQQLAALQPYTTAGTAALTPLQADIAGETSDANKFSFTPQQFQQDPEYAFEMQQQQLALQRSAAANGGLNTGGTQKATEVLANNLTSTNYGNAFNQALQSYTTNRQNTLNQISGYQNLVGTGLSATNSGNTAIGTTAAEINANNNKVAANQIAAGTYAGNTQLTAAQIKEQALTGAANANAAGIIGQANASTNALNGVTNGLGTYALYQALGKQGGTGGTSSGGGFSNAGSYTNGPGDPNGNNGGG